MNFKSFFCLGASCFVGLSFGQMVMSPRASQGARISAMRVPEIVQKARLVGHTNPNTELHVTLSLPFGDPAGMQAYADSVSDPSSPNFRNFITPEEVGAKFGMSDDKVNDVATWMKQQGFRVTDIAKNHLTISATCTAKQAEAAFGTTINDFHLDHPTVAEKQDFHAFTSPLQAPPALAPMILDVSGLDNSHRPVANTTLTPSQARYLYGLSTFFNNGYRGQGRIVAISNWDGFRLTNVPPFYNTYGLPIPGGGVGTNIKVISIDGANGQTVTAGGEADLDIQMVLGEAPLCTLLVYDNAGQDDMIGVLSKESNDNLADIISESWEWEVPDSMATAAHNIHLTMTAQGITYMQASGDTGANMGRGLFLFYPHDDPEVLQVGGTIATVDGTGNRINEVAWPGGGGGWCDDSRPFNVKPSWQTGNGVPSGINHRLIPDVSLVADGGTSGAYFFYYGGALHNDFSGTSFASPVFAGQLAVAEQHQIAVGGIPTNGSGKKRVGRIQDLIYRQNGRSDVWHDITSGNNGTLPNGQASTAHAGWDTTTGWGAINWVNMNLASYVTLKEYPTYLSTYEGTGLNTPGNVVALDGSYFKIAPTTIPNLGQAGSSSYKFTLPTTVARSSVQSVDFSITDRFATSSTGQLFLFNWSTGKWDIMKSYALNSTGVSLTTSLKSSLTTYISAAGEYRILVRGLLPISAGITNNTFDIDFVQAKVTYLPS